MHLSPPIAPACLWLLDGGALGQLLGDGALALELLVLGLGAQDVSSPVDAGALVEVSLAGVNQLAELALVLLRVA